MNSEMKDRQIERIIKRLSSLESGESVVSELVACGNAAIESLRMFLINGKPESVYQPRQHAVQALAALGARNVLIEYLVTRKQIDDPVILYAEEAVEGAAARLLSKWQDEEVYQVLMVRLHMKPLPGLIEAVAKFRRADAYPEFVKALGDSIGRTFAEDALRQAGDAAREILTAAAVTPFPTAEYETPSSLCRRRSSLRLLAEMEPAAESWHQLSSLAEDDDPEIAVRANFIALEAMSGGEQELAVVRLLRLWSVVAWGLQIEIENKILKHPGAASGPIDWEIIRCRSPKNPGNSDNELKWLVALKLKLGLDL